MVTTRTTAPAGLLRLMAVATGASVAGNYLAYPLLDVLAARLSMTETAAGFVVTAAQAGYALGLLLLVPLSDVARRRPLAVALLAITAGALVAAGAAPSGSLLLAASAVAAFASVGAQVIVPYAAELAGPRGQAHAVGVVMGGLILGTILSRFFSGVISDLSTWRTPYFVLAGILVLVAVALARALPRSDANPGGITPSGYRELLASTVTQARELPVLQLRSAVIALAVASFMVQGVALTFVLSGPRYGLSPTAIGAVGLLAAVGALSASTIGRHVDRGRGAVLTIGGLAVQALAWLLMLGAGGRIGLPALIVGLALLSLGQQCVLNASQAVVFSLRPHARGRINAVFMGTFFIGGTVGSAATAALWPRVGWTGSCLLGAALAAAGLALFLALRRVESPS